MYFTYAMFQILKLPIGGMMEIKPLLQLQKFVCLSHCLGKVSFYAYKMHFTQLDKANTVSRVKIMVAT